MSTEPANLKIIITGATGMVGEGVLLECLEHPAVKQVLLVNRKPYHSAHPKLRELIVPNFLELDTLSAQLTGYEACFYCAGVSSVGMTEGDYSRIIYDTTLHFASTLANLNPKMAFIYVSGAQTDTSERGRVMWARVKGRTENALMKLPFKSVYNFRPGFMKPTKGQRNSKSYYKAIGWLYPILHLLLPNQVSTMRQVGLAMINSLLTGYPKQILEIKDISALASFR